MKINLTMTCVLAGAALLCTSAALPAAAHPHGGARGGGEHASGAHFARGGRYGANWHGGWRGGPQWWGWEPGFGFGWDGAYYYGSPYAWSPGYYMQYDATSPIDMPSARVMPPADYAVRPAPPGAANWYYCASARIYYPYISQCPEAWQVVHAVPAGDAN